MKFLGLGSESQSAAAGQVAANLRQIKVGCNPRRNLLKRTANDALRYREKRCVIRPTSDSNAHPVRGILTGDSDKGSVYEF